MFSLDYLNPHASWYEDFYFILKGGEKPLAISRSRKEELVAQYTELISQSKAIFLTNYQGMDVKSINKLRTEVLEAEGALHVTKNTLLLKALEDNDISVPENFLQGQLATGFALSEAPTLAKKLVDFAKSEDKLELVGGFIGNEFLTPEGIETLAKLPSLDELRAQIIGLVNAPAQNIVSAVTNGVRQVINVIDAYAKSENDDSDE